MLQEQYNYLDFGLLLFRLTASLEDEHQLEIGGLDDSFQCCDFYIFFFHLKLLSKSG